MKGDKCRKSTLSKLRRQLSMENALPGTKWFLGKGEESKPLAGPGCPSARPALGTCFSHVRRKALITPLGHWLGLSQFAQYRFARPDATGSKM